MGTFLFSCSRQVVAIALMAILLAPGLARACTCVGTTSIGEALESAERVVLGRVQGKQPISPDRFDGVVQVYPDAAVVEVLEVLKGSAPSRILVSADFMCYSTFEVEDFRTGDTFVFAIEQTNDQDINVLPSCSHSALKLVDGRLFTNELIRDGNRQLQPYMGLTSLKWLVRLRLTGPLGQSVYAASLVLLASLLATRQVRKRAVQTAAQRPPLRWRTIVAIAWFVLWAGVCVLITINERSLLPAIVGALFAAAAIGIAFRWPWAEGLTYGMTLVWIGATVILTWQAVDWFNSEGFGEQLFYLLAIEAVCLAVMVWCVDAVRRHFSPVTHLPEGDAGE